MKTVITYGTYDLFHVGHLKLLKRLKELGDNLIVGISTDEFNKIKGKKTVISYEERAEIVGSIKYVDKVFPEGNWIQKREDIIRESADIFAMGDDWAGHFDDLMDICDVIYLPRTKNISTTNLKQIIKNVNNEKIIEIRQVVKHLSDLIGVL